jgi:ABC-2 type transport system ATP-binding protein
VGTPMGPENTTGARVTPKPGRSDAGAPAVRIEHLTKRLRNGITAVDDLDLTVEVGEVLGLVGPNGSGKTLTLKILLGLVRPTAGHASIFGEPVRPGAPVLARVGALVDGPGFVPHLSGRRNLDLACRLIRLSGGEPDLDGAVAMTGLGPAIDRPFSDYSHGMRYRLALAQALLGRPDLLLLDEPTTGMDPAQVVEVRDAIAASAAAGATVVLSSHDFSEIELVCTHAAVLREGRLVAAGPMAEMVERRPRLRMGVDAPDRAVALLRAVDGVTRADTAGGSGVLVEAAALRPVDLVDALDAAGITVTEFRGATFEDTYLELFRDGAGPSEERHRSAP